MRPDQRTPAACDRRGFLRHAGGGLGAIALQALLADEAHAAGVLARPRARCRRVVQLFMAGGAAAIDLFDHKPELWKSDGQPSDFGEPIEAFQDNFGPWFGPQWPFSPRGESRTMLGETMAPLGAHVDDLAFVHDVTSRSGVHSAATLLATTASRGPASPARAAGSATASAWPTTTCRRAGAARRSTRMRACRSPTCTRTRPATA
jgi:hypothetical protein